MTYGTGGELDQRQRRTRAALHEALERMIARLPYAQIGISQLAEEAGIGRPTFYRHFPTVNALLTDRMAKDFADQRDLAKRLAEEGSDAYQALLEVAEFGLRRIGDRPKIYRALLDGSAGANATTLLREHITDLMTYQPLPTGDGRNENVDLSIGLMSGAISGFLLAWMETGLHPAPPDAAKLLLTMLNLEEGAFVKQTELRVSSSR